jgi:DNA-binding NtrC family response regulator
VRVIAATNRLPELALSSGKLREDLLYRLNVFPIDMPPLRDRVEDIPLLSQHFLAQICEREGVARSFSPAATARLTAYRWPGNVRELRNVVQRAYVMANGPLITDEWLPYDASMPAAPAASTGRAAAAPAPAPLPARAPAAASGVPSITIPIGTSMAEAERQLILATLEHFNQQKERTAAALGVSLKTLYNRLKEYSQDKADVASPE